MSRRIMKMEIPLLALEGLLTDGRTFTCLKGIPPTARLHGAYGFDICTGQIVVLVEDDSFPESVEGEHLRYLPQPYFRQRQVGEADSSEFQSLEKTVSESLQ